MRAGIFALLRIRTPQGLFFKTIKRDYFISKQHDELSELIVGSTSRCAYVGFVIKETGCEQEHSAHTPLIIGLQEAWKSDREMVQ